MAGWDRVPKQNSEIREGIRRGSPNDHPRPPDESPVPSPSAAPQPAGRATGRPRPSAAPQPSARGTAPAPSAHPAAGQWPACRQAAHDRSAQWRIREPATARPPFADSRLDTNGTSPGLAPRAHATPTPASPLAHRLGNPPIARPRSQAPRWTMMTIGTLALFALLQVPAPAQELAPGTRYDPAIPTLQQVVGHDFREEITAPADVIRYMEALAEAAPDRTHLFEYARSWEGRPLVMLV